MPKPRLAGLRPSKQGPASRYGATGPKPSYFGVSIYTQLKLTNKVAEVVRRLGDNEAQDDQCALKGPPFLLSPCHDRPQETPHRTTVS